MPRFLKDPENARAYKWLAAHPNGSLRTWAKSLSWSQGKLQRFLKAASELGLATVTSSREGSVFVPAIAGRIGASAEPDARASAEPDAPDAPPIYSRARAVGLTTTTRLTALSPRAPTRNRESVVNPERIDFRLKSRLRDDERQEGAGELIAAMNVILCRNHPLEFLPVDLEQRGSHLAARRWLVDAGVPLEDALKILRVKCANFNPAKVFNAEMPRSLGFFTRGVLAEWRRVLRDREQFKLFPKDELHVDSQRAKRPPGKFEPLSAIMANINNQLGAKRK